MMDAVAMFRRWLAFEEYDAVREGCLDLETFEPSVQVLHALASARLGDTSSARRLIDKVDPETLDGATLIDLADLHIVLGQGAVACGLLEGALLEPIDLDASARSRLLAGLAWCRQREARPGAAISLLQASLRHESGMAAYVRLLTLYRESLQLDAMETCLRSAQQYLSAASDGWPERFQLNSARRLRLLQLDVWHCRDTSAAAENWLEEQRQQLEQDEWCRLMCAWAERLVLRDRYAQAEECVRGALLHYPDNLPAHLELARIAQVQGRMRQAIGVLARAIRVAAQTDQPADRYWARLSGYALHIDLTLAHHAVEKAASELARSDAQRASDYGQRRLDVELALAGVEAEQAQYEAAEARYRAILRDRPHWVAALEGYGRMCMQLGRIEEAIGLFESVKARDAARGHSALMSMRHFPAEQSTLYDLETLARSSRLEAGQRAALMFQLASAWEKRGDYAKAFALANEANKSSRPFIAYDAAAHRRHCERIRHAFPAALYEHRSGGLPTTVPVFIVGMPRSGTTLVEQILAGHSRIHGAGELGIIPSVVAGLERWERETGSGRHYPDCVDDLDARVIRGIAQDVLDELQSLSPAAHHVCDKLPHNFQHIGLIRLLFPHARIISVRRDPRDVAISNYFTDYAARFGGMGFAYDMTWIGEQLSSHRMLMDHWHQAVSDIFEVEYESLVADPETGARQLLDYIGVEWEPEVLEHHTLQRPVKTASLWQIRQPIYTSSVQRWRRYEQSLAPLLAAMNIKSNAARIDMVTLPEPGLLNRGVDAYRQDAIDQAEYRFKLLLHHLPGHGAAMFMLGLVYVRKGYTDDGIELMVQSLKRCPWRRDWRDTLINVYRDNGQDAQALALADAAGAAERPGSSTPPAVHLGRRKVEESSEAGE